MLRLRLCSVVIFPIGIDVIGLPLRVKVVETSSTTMNIDIDDD